MEPHHCCAQSRNTAAEVNHQRFRSAFEVQVCRGRARRSGARHLGAWRSVHAAPRSFRTPVKPRSCKE
eukprot:5995606-Alexandrium_andersonii.AAC.1